MKTQHTRTSVFIMLMIRATTNDSRLVQLFGVW